MAKLSKEAQSMFEGVMESFKTGGMSSAISTLQRNQAIMQADALAENARIADANNKSILKAEAEKKAAKPEKKPDSEK